MRKVWYNTDQLEGQQLKLFPTHSRFVKDKQQGYGLEMLEYLYL